MWGSRRPLKVAVGTFVGSSWVGVDYDSEFLGPCVANMFI